MLDRSKPQNHIDEDADHDDFLINEGLDLLNAYRAIQSQEARSAIRQMVAAIAQAEMDAEERAA